MSSILIKNKGPKALSLNESQEVKGKKYVFEGVFTQCGVENRNNRIYDPEEILPHLAYLRDKIKNEGCILGELDHPEGRFEVYIKDASHKITDLWYEPETKCVMGKLELLNTTNGKTMQAVVDAGCPLFVSSRAAGTVGADKHVTIQQIFTYDIVAVPGFAEAKLDRVDESMRARVMSFLNESKSAQTENNLAAQYGIDDELTIVTESSFTPVISEKKYNVDIDELSKPINEDIKVKVSPEKARELGLIGNKDNQQDTSGDVQDAPEEKKHSADEILGIVPKYAGQDPSFIQDIQPEFKSPEASTDSNGASVSAAQPQQNNTQNNPMQEAKKGKTAYINLMNESIKKEEKDQENQQVKKKYDEGIDLNEEGDDVPNPIADGKKGSDTDKIVASSHKKEEKEEKGGNDEKVDQKATSKNDKAEEQSEIKESEKISDENDEEGLCPGCGKDIAHCVCEENDQNIQRLKSKKEEIKESTDKLLGFYDHIIEGVDTKANIRESIIRQWPFSISLSESNFEKFAILSPEDKNKCADFIWKNKIFDIQRINETFMRPLSEKINETKNFLRLASASDVQLYMNAPEHIKKNIEEQAACFILESKEDVDEFWRLTGLRETLNKQVQNESFVEDFNKKMTEGVDQRDQNGFLRAYGYDQSFIEQVGRMM